MSKCHIVGNLMPRLNSIYSNQGRLHGRVMYRTIYASNMFSLHSDSDQSGKHKQTAIPEMDMQEI